MSELRFEHLEVSVGDAAVVRDVSFSITTGRIAALMGPNGSGKSSLVHAVMGHPRYHSTGGRVMLDGTDITALPPHEKAKKGIFLSLQNPPALPGVTVSSFLRTIVSNSTGTRVPVMEFKSRLEKEMERLAIPKEMAYRSMHEGFSGGEKKRLEALQLSLLKPKFALLDETDAGLDIDALRIVAEAIKRMAPNMGILVITHHTRILQYLTPNTVYVMQDGRIVRSGSGALAEEIEKHGYKK